MSRSSLRPVDITSRAGIPITTPARTLVDVASELRGTELERSVNEADKYDLIDPDVETDGLRYHRTPSEQTRDHQRDQTHVAAGLTTLRFTHWQVRYEPAYVRRILQRTAQRLIAT